MFHMPLFLSKETLTSVSFIPNQALEDNMLKERSQRQGRFKHRLKKRPLCIDGPRGLRIIFQLAKEETPWQGRQCLPWHTAGPWGLRWQGGQASPQAGDKLEASLWVSAGSPFPEKVLCNSFSTFSEISYLIIQKLLVQCISDGCKRIGFFL